MGRRCTADRQRIEQIHLALNGLTFDVRETNLRDPEVVDWITKYIALMAFSQADVLNAMTIRVGVTDAEAMMALATAYSAAANAFRDAAGATQLAASCVTSSARFLSQLADYFGSGRSWATQKLVRGWGVHPAQLAAVGPPVSCHCRGLGGYRSPGSVRLIQMIQRRCGDSLPARACSAAARPAWVRSSQVE